MLTRSGEEEEDGALPAYMSLRNRSRSIQLCTGWSHVKYRDAR
jgi:hypothetical protein